MKKKRLISFIIAVAMVMTLAVSPVMAWSAKNTKCYTITTGNTTVYNSNSTSSGKKGTIYGSDEIKILSSYSNGFYYVEYPITRGTKQGYILKSDVLISTSASTRYATSKITTYRRNNTDNPYGSIYKDDEVLVFGTRGSFTQIRYPVSGGYKFAWIKNSDANNYLRTSKNRSTYNDVFASLKGSGYSLNQALSSQSTSFTQGQWVYVWGYLHDANNNLYKTYGSGKCNLTLSIYRPNGSCAHTYTYNDCDNNWIGTRLDQAGTWKIQSKISGALTGTNTRTITVKETKTASNSLFKNSSEIYNAASKYNIQTNSNAFKALQAIDRKYYDKLKGNKTGINIFLFEGVGASSSTSNRMNAMCVVVKNGSIVYINKYCSTLPDNPFKPSTNQGDPVPTLRSGTYSFTTTNHRTDKPVSKRYIPYAALHVEGTNNNVVRHRSKNDYWYGRSDSINVHGRSGKWTSSSSNSAGCQIVGDIFGSYPSEYSNFIKAVGIVSQNTKVTKGTYKEANKTGRIVIDRSYARSYLQNIGYSDKAINMIGTN